MMVRGVFSSWLASEMNCCCFLSASSMGLTIVGEEIDDDEQNGERDEAAEHRAQNHLVGERLRGRAVYYADQKAILHKIDAIEVIFVFPPAFRAVRGRIFQIDRKILPLVDEAEDIFDFVRGKEIPRVGVHHEGARPRTAQHETAVTVEFRRRVEGVEHIFDLFFLRGLRGQDNRRAHAEKDDQQNSHDDGDKLPPRPVNHPFSPACIRCRAGILW